MVSRRSTGAVQQQHLQQQLWNVVTTPFRSRQGLAVLFLYLFGLYVSFLGQPLSKPTDAQLSQYYQAERIADESLREASQLYANVMMKDAEIGQAKTWFWQFNQQKRGEVNSLQKERRVLFNEYRKADREARKKMRIAKSNLGVWSESAVHEAKELFRTSFQRSKVIARRRTFYDVLFQLFMDRESELAGRILQAIFFLVINLASAMLGCFILFGIELPGIIYSYGPNVLSGVVFFLVGMIGAASVIITFMVVVSGAAVGTGFVVVQVALGQQRLRDGRRRQQLGGSGHRHRD